MTLISRMPSFHVPKRALGGDESVKYSRCRPIGSHLWQNDSVHGSGGSQMCDHHLPDRGNTRRSIFSPYLYHLYQCPVGTSHAHRKSIRHQPCIEETDYFNHVAFINDITVLAQDNLGLQILMDAVQEFEIRSNTN